MHTPWGASDHTQPAGLRGVLAVQTPGHGGYMVTNAVGLARLSPEAQAIGKSNYGYTATHYCFEEDCAYAVLLWELPEVREFSRQEQLTFVTGDYAKEIATPDGHTAHLYRVLHSYYREYLRAHPTPKY